MGMGIWDGQLGEEGRVQEREQEVPPRECGREEIRGEQAGREDELQVAQVAFMHILTFCRWFSGSLV